MCTTLFRFVKQVACLAQKDCAAGLVTVSDPTGNGYPGWKHVVLHYLRIEMDTSTGKRLITPLRWTEFGDYSISRSSDSRAIDVVQVVSPNAHVGVEAPVSGVG